MVRVLLILVCAALIPWPSAIAADTRTMGAAENWTAHNGADDESAFSRLKQIDTGNVKRLGLAWALDLPGEASLEATPLAVDGVVFFTGGSGSIYAADGQSGTLLWKHDPEVWKHNPDKIALSMPVNRGAAYADGRVFSGTLDGRLLALDAKTGKLLWSVQTLPPNAKHTITGVPRTFKGKVIIGQGGADHGARGFVTAYDAATGKQAWRFYTVPGAPEENKGDPVMERAAATWSGEYWKTGSGGTVWNAMTFDPEFNRIYIGTGNGGPYDVTVRSPGNGDNLYLASIVALDADTGKYIWHYQVNPRDAWDYKCTPDIIAATLMLEGKPRKVLLHAPTNGFFYVLDRATGKLISAEKTGKVTWAERIDLGTGRPVEVPNARYENGEAIIYPGPQGSHNWQTMSFNPGTGLVYIPYMQLGARFVKGKRIPGGVYVGADLSLIGVTPDPEDGKGALIAWDPVRQKAAWKVQHETLWNGGTMTTAGNLVFQGTADGYLSAYNATTGERLWRQNAGMGIIGAPMSYSVNGKQYVSVLAGYGGSAAIWGDLMNVGWKYSGPRRLLTFVLDGKAVMPSSPPRDMTVAAVDDPSVKLDPADVAAGSELFAQCEACHGLDLVAAGGPGPDLRESQIALDPESFWSVVHDGSLVQNSMPPFKDMTRSQVMQIQTYIRAEARAVLAAQKAKPPAKGASY